MKKIILLSSALLIALCFNAQNTISQLDILKMKFPNANHEKCKSDVIHQKLMQTDQEYSSRISANEALIQNYLNTAHLKSGGVYTIPVVVHVMHLGESVGTGTNISDAQIQSAIDNLNDAYRNVGYNGIDIGIEFALAQRDENCNASTGINRVLSTGVSGYSADGITDANEAALKATSKWSNISYYNIWVVSEIDGNNGGSGTQGYAYFPGAGASVDGTVILYNAFGYDPNHPALGYNLKSYTNYNATAIHELGHGLNLYHTFQGDDGDGDGTADQCPVDTDPNADGDLCADTDAHRRDDSDCDVILNTCHGVSNSTVYNNFMAYSSDECQDRFTTNQKDRMLAALLTTRVGLTNSLGATAPNETAPIAATCTPNYTTPNSFNMGVAGFEFNTINVASGTSQSEEGYQDRTCHFKTTIETGLSYNINVEGGTANNQDVEVWIDYNNDGDFDDANENIFSGANDISFNGSVTVPSSGVVLNTYLRVRVIVDWFNNTISGPCYNPQYGEVEEYSVMVTSSGVAPVADFSASTVTPCQNESVTFTDLSTESPTGWSWNFGDGFVSSSQNPSHAYASAGVYTVTLTASNATGSDDEVKTGYITVTATEDASFSYSSATYCTTDSDPTATITGTVGGLFTSSPVGLSINGSSGLIDVSASTIGTYTVTYTTPGTCSAASDVQVEIQTCSTVPSTTLRTQDCGRTLSSTSDLFYADAVANADYYQFEFDDAANPGVNTFVYTRHVRYTNFNLIGASKYSLNTTYNVRVRAKVNGEWGDFNSVCQLSTQATVPSTELRGQDCGRTLSSSSDLFYANSVDGATYYQFEFDDAANPGVNTFVYTRHVRYTNFSLIGLSKYSLNTTYNVRVRAKVGGVWGSYNNVCQLSTPSNVEDTKLRTQDCGKTLTSLSDLFYADEAVGATYYKFEFDDAANPGATTFEYTRHVRYTNFSLVGSSKFVANRTYNVRVKAYVGGVWGNYNTVCQLIIGPSVIITNDNNVAKSLDLGLSKVKQLDMLIYPNPSTGQFSIEFTENQDGKIVQLLNATGQIVYSEIINSSRVEMNQTDLPKGIYFIRVIGEDQQGQLKKVIIE